MEFDEKTKVESMVLLVKMLARIIFELKCEGHECYFWKLYKDIDRIERYLLKELEAIDSK